MMVRSTLKWVLILAALLVVGPIAGRLMASLRSPSGEATTALLSVPVAGGLARAAAVMGLAAGLGLATARLIGSRPGMTVTGLVLAWPAWFMGSLEDLVAQAGSSRASGMFITLAIEGLMFGAAMLGLAQLVWMAGAREDARAAARRAGHAVAARPTASAVLTSVLAATALAGVVVWWVGFQPLKGQSMFAALAGGIAAGAAAHLMAPHLPARISAIAAFAAMAVLAAAGPLTVFVLGAGPGAGLRAAAAGAMSHLANPVGLDWAAGAFLGVPIGLNWSGSMVEKHTLSAATA